MKVLSLFPRICFISCRGFSIHQVRDLSTGLIMSEEQQQCNESVSVVHLMQTMNLGLPHPSQVPNLDLFDLSAMISFHRKVHFQ